MLVSIEEYKLYGYFRLMFELTKDNILMVQIWQIDSANF